jgi:hypothetical protein
VNQTFIDFMVRDGFLQELDVTALTREWKEVGLGRWWDAVGGEQSM